jgi:hypothetical protein
MVAIANRLLTFETFLTWNDGSDRAFEHAGLGGVQYVGAPKQPTVTVNYLIDGEYVAKQYQGAGAIVSPMFPGLQITVADIVAMTEE